MESRAALTRSAARRGPLPIARAASLALTCALGALGASIADAQEAGGPWYVGVGAGVSRLTPDTDASSLSLSEDASEAFGVWFGRDLSRRFAVEGALASLGDATLSDGATIGYRVASVGALAHVLGRRGADAPSLYLRAGLGFVSNESELELEQADATSIWAAAGAQWPFARRWAVRGEVASYDGDAQAGFLSVFRRFGEVRRPASVVGRETVTATPVEEREPIPAGPIANAPAPSPDLAPTPRTTPRTVSAPALEPAPRPVPVADCPVPAPAEPVGADGCARFSGTLAGVDFVDGTAVPTPIATRLLGRTAAELAGFPGLVVEIRAHVDGAAGAAAAQGLSRERAVAVARALAAGGVDVSRLRARAFGATRPRASDATSGGRRLNNRIELAVLP